MKSKRTHAPVRRVLVILAFYLSVILASLILGITGQVAGWVAQTAVALSLFRLVFIFGWGAAKNSLGWRA